MFEHSQTGKTDSVLNKPLQKRVFITTRPEGRSDELNELLRSAGASLVEFPMIEIVAYSENPKLKSQLKLIKRTDWLIFTSANGVRHFFLALKKNGLKINPTNKVRFAVIGEKTAQALDENGFDADIVANKSSAREFGEKLKEIIPENNRVTLVLGNLASTELEDKLFGKVKIDRIDIYKTIIPEKTDESVWDMIRNDKYDQLIFTSPSGIQNFILLSGGQLDTSLLRIVCIGETTAAFARESGIIPSEIAHSPSAEGIFKSIVNLYNHS